jgi:hypothetical protein
MGMNYYASRVCASCNHDDRLHIGKSSRGWCFSLHVIPERGLNSLGDWETFLENGWSIVDESDVPRSLYELMQTITERSFHREADVTDEWMLRLSHAECGPNGLVRFTIDGVHCIGHGEGTWDLVVGDFS